MPSHIFADEDGIKSGELENDFAEMNGYEAEPEATILLNSLGIAEALHQKKMKELEGGEKCVCSLLRPCSETRTFCSWTSPPTTWTSSPLPGSRSFSTGSKTRSSWYHMTVIS
jgi:ATPase components of ABC transporters with duplicated ATPase domains